jgi:hypothetical protein
MFQNCEFYQGSESSTILDGFTISRVAVIILTCGMAGLCMTYLNVNLAFTSNNSQKRDIVLGSYFPYSI